MMDVFERCRIGVHRWFTLGEHTFCKWCGEVKA